MVQGSISKTIANQLALKAKLLYLSITYQSSFAKTFVNQD